MKRLNIAFTILLLTLAPQAVLALAPAEPSIELEVSPAKVEVAPGGSVQVTLTVYSIQGFEDDVKLEAAVSAAGVTVGFDPNPVNVPGFATGVSTVTVTAAPDAALGKVSVEVTGTAVKDSKVKRSTTLEVNIGGAAQPGGGQQPGGGEQPGGGQQPGGGGEQPVEVKTTTVTTTLTSTITETTTMTITTASPVISTKTTATPAQVTDYTLPIATAIVVLALMAVAALALKRGKSP